MALVNPYATIAQVRDELQNDDADLTATIETAINAASRWIDEYKGRDYLAHDHTSTPIDITPFYPHVIGQTLLLPYDNVRTLGDVVDAGTTLVEGTDFFRDGHRLHRLDGNWDPFYPPDHLKIYGAFGYAQATTADVPTGLPSHINRAAVLLAASMSGHLSKEVVGIDGGKTSVVVKDVPKAVRDILGPRRLVA